MPMKDLLLQTPRLSVRRWRRDDLPAILAVYSDRDAMRFVGDGPRGCRSWVWRIRKRDATRPGGLLTCLQARAEVLAPARIRDGIEHASHSSVT
ncbi:MAG: hypothetical protein P8J59_04195 [Phycisphaerales bacterium]|nr:hypothetical protein [Phycisphaerales bacterium]